MSLHPLLVSFRQIKAERLFDARCHFVNIPRKHQAAVSRHWDGNNFLSTWKVDPFQPSIPRHALVNYDWGNVLFIRSPSGCLTYFTKDLVQSIICPPVRSSTSSSTVRVSWYFKRAQHHHVPADVVERPHFPRLQLSLYNFFTPSTTSTSPPPLEPPSALNVSITRWRVALRQSPTSSLPEPPPIQYPL